MVNEGKRGEDDDDGEMVRGLWLCVRENGGERERKEDIVVELERQGY